MAQAHLESRGVAFAAMGDFAQDVIEEGTMAQRMLVTGPARSGKSEWAEWLAQDSGQAVIYVATSVVDAADVEWQRRVDQHQQRRPAAWRTLEVPLQIAPVLRQAAVTDCVLLDSLGTWVANGLEQEDRTWYGIVDDLLLAVTQARCTLIVVAEETGWGVIPAYPLGRQFRDRLGSVVRQVGQCMDAVYLVTGGHAINLCQIGVAIDTAIGKS